ncbi:WD40 repeat-like protein [Trichodelitschia bisporula]|uniref:WD40 repeat-like protein n=1 Tax=Trichodelitschia bisporula TaxID=703511 RepID=A0A6G1I3Y1_9PEZI|nr:WD40 repeat-like protein [Trichodelitschia bisporula]
MTTSTKGAVPTGYADEIAISETSFRSAQRAVQNAGHTSKKRKREDRGDPGVMYGAAAYKGPWAKFKEDTPEASSGSEEEVEVEVEYEDDEEIEDLGPQAGLAPMATDYAPEEAGETSEFLGSSMYDYQGRTYMHVPLDLDIDLRGDTSNIKNYVPKKEVFAWRQQKGSAITQMRFFPDSGHLLLSATASGKVSLFDVYHNRELLRTYSGHTKRCNDICFNNDGTEFLTASYDHYMKLWDTETGKCKAKFTTGKTPHVIRFNPSINNEFLAGMSDKKIVQYDTRSGELVQEYDHHLGPVNTITFCDENRRFVTTSDDKSLRAWEYGIPVPIKFIAEPYMFSMNRSAAHPRKPFIALQSSDNQIVVYASSERFRQNRKKSFRGHNNAGYAIDVAISPDGEFVMSGDTGGYVCWWSWKTCKMLHKIQAADTPVVACQFHPRETSKAITGDLDGIIKYWD